MSEFGIDRARELAADSHRMAKESLADAVAARPASSARQPAATAELEGIADFIFTRTS